MFPLLGIWEGFCLPDECGLLDKLGGKKACYRDVESTEPWLGEL
jgi:hypothetical protein